MNIKRISDKLTIALKNENLQEIATEFTEVFIDTKLAEGVLKELPGTNILVGAFKAFTSIQDALFVRKLSAFLNEIKDIPLKEREEMITEIDSSTNHRIRVGEKLLYIIDKCDDPDKAQLTAILFKCVAQKKMDYDTFLRCALVIEQSMLDELQEFILHDDIKYSIESYSDYLAWGLLQFEPFSIELEEMNSYDEYNSKEYKLHNGTLELQLSWAGKKIRENLRDFVHSNNDFFDITTISKVNVELHIKTIFDIYLKPEYQHKLEHVLKRTLLQMYNNPHLENDEFYDLASFIIKTSGIEISIFNNYFNEHADNFSKLALLFDCQRWHEFKDKYNLKLYEDFMKENE